MTTLKEDRGFRKSQKEESREMQESREEFLGHTFRPACRVSSNQEQGPQGGYFGGCNVWEEEDAGDYRGGGVPVCKGGCTEGEARRHRHGVEVKTGVQSGTAEQKRETRLGRGVAS